MRLLRATKNRFGSTEEVGVFEMAGHGLVEVADPGRAFLASTDEHAPGSVAGSTLEGSRPLLVEVQATRCSRRTTAVHDERRPGVDSNRLALLIAVLGRRAGIGLGSHDVYANLAGGLDLDDPGLDLPLCPGSGIVSARQAGRRTISSRSARSGCWANCARCPAWSVDFGKRLASVSRPGSFPKSRHGDAPQVEGMTIVAVSNLREAVARAIGGGPADVRDVVGASPGSASRGLPEGD